MYYKHQKYIGGALEIKSILKSIYFTKSNGSDADYARVVQTALIELSQWGEEVFNKYAPEIVRVAAQNEIFLNHTSWGRCFEEVPSLECYEK